MQYMRWTEQDIKDLRGFKGVVLLLTEVDREGNVVREIGLDERGDVVHACPSPEDERGLFDLAPIDVASVRSDMSRSEFELHWSKRHGTE